MSLHNFCAYLFNVDTHSNFNKHISQLISSEPQVRAFRSALPPDSNICTTSIHKRIPFSNRSGMDARLRIRYLVTGGALFHYKSRLRFLAVEKGIVHFMDEGMSSIQGCLFDDRRGAKP